MEAVALRAGAWLTATALDALAEYFVQNSVERGCKWLDDLRSWKRSKELQVIESVHQDLNEGLRALSRSIRNLGVQHNEGTAAMLGALVELKESNRRDDQLGALREAVIALNDIRNKRFGSESSRNVDLLKTATDSAHRAARIANGSLRTKLQAYRVWIIAEYMYEAAHSQSCLSAKKSTLYIVAKVILQDDELRQICDAYCKARPSNYSDIWYPEGQGSVPQTPASTRSSRSTARRSNTPALRHPYTPAPKASSSPARKFPTGESRSSREVDQSCRGRYRYTSEESTSSEDRRVSTVWGGSPDSSYHQGHSTHEERVDEPCVVAEEEVLQFLVEVISSVIMLAPLDQDVRRDGVMTVEGGVLKSVEGGKTQFMGGGLKFGNEAPEEVILAMGKFCSANPLLRELYPVVSGVVEDAWGQSKETLALNNLFAKMGGKDWTHNEGWTDARRNLTNTGDLSRRFGIATEKSHVTKINLAANNLCGKLDDDLADCEHLRELVLHGNSIQGGVPPRLRNFLRDSGVVVTGLPEGDRAVTSGVLEKPLGKEKVKPKARKTKSNGFVNFMRGATQAGWST